MPTTNEIRRGDIFMVVWEGAGIHPALVIQNDTGNKHSERTIVAYITSTPPKNIPVLVGFSDHDSGLDHGGSIDLSRIMTVPKAFLREKKGLLSSRKMPEVDRALFASLGISRESIW